MKIIRIIGRNIRDAFKSVFRNFALSLASISSITITLMVVAIAIVLSFNINHSAEIMAKNIEIVAFIKPDTSQEDINRIESEITKLDNMENYRFKSKKEIAEEYMSTSEVLKSIMSVWTEEENPLQNTFIIKVVDNKFISDTASRIGEIEGISNVNYGKGMVEQLLVFFEFIKDISISSVIALILVTAFLITNTIKITIFSRKREIEIMRLVGASNINIKIPFILEGFFLGVLGSIIPIIAISYGYNKLVNVDMSMIMPVIKLVDPNPFIYQVALLLLALGIIVGMFGSWRAVRKHLKI